MLDFGINPPDDVLIEREVDHVLKQGLTLPRWGWAVPRPYNGFTGPERILGWQKLVVARRLGLVMREWNCLVCQAAEAVGDHTEIYARPMITLPVCRSCHFRIHRRFDAPDRWQAMVLQRGAVGDPVCALRITELRRQEALAVASERDVFAALAGHHATSAIR